MKWLARSAVFFLAFWIGSVVASYNRPCGLCNCVVDFRHDGVVMDGISVAESFSSERIPENTSMALKSPRYLCKHLADIEHMAWDPSQPSGDAVYDGLRHNAYYSLPCLANQLTNTRPMENPTGAPFMAGLTYRVGDTALFMLMDNCDNVWPKGMLPPKYERMFKDEGMFAYFFYVNEVPGARKNVQRWWRKWMHTCQPECAIVDSLEGRRD